MSAYSHFYYIGIVIFRLVQKIIIPNPSTAAARPEWKGMI